MWTITTRERVGIPKGFVKIATGVVRPTDRILDLYDWVRAGSRYKNT